MFRTDLRGFYKKYPYSHDAMPWESYADLWGLRMDLQRNGIFDSTLPNNEFTR